MTTRRPTPTVAELRARIQAIPRTPLATLPTPLEEQPRAIDSPLDSYMVTRAPAAAMSRYLETNAYLLNPMVAETVDLLVRRGVQPPVWMSGAALGGDGANARFVSCFKGRARKL